MIKKVVFLGSKAIGLDCLKILYKYHVESIIELDSVFTNNNNRFSKESISEFCKARNIPVFNSSDLLLERQNIDVLLSVQYHQILKQYHLDVANEIAVNLHMAPLPELRGCNQFSFAIYNNYSTFGTTFHEMNTGIDSGDILFERRFDIPKDCLVDQLYKLTHIESIKLFKDHIIDILNGNYEKKPQSTFIKQRSSKTYYRNDISKLKTLNFNQGIEDFVNRIRATSMPGFEPPFFEFSGRKYYVIPSEHFNKEK